MPIKMHRFCISCSSETEMNRKHLFVWGDDRGLAGLPTSLGETMRRLARCKIKIGCSQCDAEIHKFSLPRSVKTYKQSLNE